MSEPLHILYRPQELSEVAGNKGAITAIEALLERDIKDIPHAWLFSGGSGCGKTTLARIVADKLGCSDMDFYEYNSSSMRGIDTIRDIEQRSKLSPMNGKVKVYLLDEVHQLTSAAQDASLKILEDAPQNVFFFLATTNPEKLKKAIRTRCTDIAVKSLNSREIMGLLKEIVEAEEKEVDVEVIKKISMSCDGSPREAVKMLDMVIDTPEKDLALEVIENTHVSESSVIELCRMINKKDKWKNIAKVLDNLDADPEQTRRAILTYFYKVLLSNGSVTTAEILEHFEDNYFDSGKAGLALSCFAASQL
jgi:DNA polymerase-3 subunit gamma/tau